MIGLKKGLLMMTVNFPLSLQHITDNQYLNQEEYSKQLDKLNELTRLQLKYGDWNAVLKSGLLVSRDSLKNSLISYKNTYRTWQPSFCTIGIDPASTGHDKFAMSCLVYFNNGNIVLVDLDSTPSAYLEELLRILLLEIQCGILTLIIFSKNLEVIQHTP